MIQASANMKINALIIALPMLFSLTASAQDSEGNLDSHFGVILRDLGSESYEVRERASGELEALGLNIVPHIQNALDQIRDPEVKARLRHTLRKLCRVRAVLRIIRPEIDLGDSIRWYVALVNEQLEPVMLAKPPDTSVECWLWPRLRFEVEGPGGVPVTLGSATFCNGKHKLFGGEITRTCEKYFAPLSWLVPRGRRMVIASWWTGRAGGGILDSWRPGVPGIYRIRCIYDSTVAQPPLIRASVPIPLDRWNPDLMLIQREQIVSEWVELSVLKLEEDY